MVLKPAELAPDDPLHGKVRERAGALPHERTVLDEAERQRLHAADAEALEAARRFALDHGLRVVEASTLRHDLVVEGERDAVEAAFGVELHEVEHELHGRFRSHEGHVHLPGELHGRVAGVLGLHTVRRVRPLAASGPAAGHAPSELATRYRFPDASGAGERVAVLSFGGGFHDRDLDAFFATVEDGSRPDVRESGVDGARNEPLEHGRLGAFAEALADPDQTLASLSDRFGPEDTARAIMTIETTLDVQIASALAPGAEIDVYFTRNDARGFYMAVNAALGLATTDEASGTADRPRLPTAISVSWGESEAVWGRDMAVMDAVLARARHADVTVCCASGDLGSWTRQEPGLPANVSFPASSPHALAVGGTSVPVIGTGIRADERVWNGRFLGQRAASGGGVSGHFPRPDYQRRSPVPVAGRVDPGTWKDPERGDDFEGRGLPDVAALADPAVGYRIVVGGREVVIGGTSAAAPLWAALVARLAERLGHPTGWLNPLLYRPDLSRGLRSVRTGDNDVAGGDVAYFRAADGWDPCTGLGVPSGDELLRALTGEEG